MAESISYSMSMNSTEYLTQTQLSNESESAEKQTTEETSKENMSTDEIIDELSRDGMVSTMSAQDIADEYGVSLMKAQEILDELNSDENGYVRENPAPEGATISYKV